MSENIKVNNNILAKASEAVKTRSEKIAQIRKEEEKRVQNNAEAAALRILDIFVSSNDGEPECWVWKVIITYSTEKSSMGQSYLKCSVAFKDDIKHECPKEAATMEENKKNSMLKKLKASMQALNEIEFIGDILNKIKLIIDEVPEFEASLNIEGAVLTVTMSEIK